MELRVELVDGNEGAAPEGSEQEAGEAEHLLRAGGLV